MVDKKQLKQEEKLNKKLEKMFKDDKIYGIIVASDYGNHILVRDTKGLTLLAGAAKTVTYMQDKKLKITAEANLLQSLMGDLMPADADVKEKIDSVIDKMFNKKDDGSHKSYHG